MEDQEWATAREASLGWEMEMAKELWLVQETATARGRSLAWGADSWVWVPGWLAWALAYLLVMGPMLGWA